MNDELTADERLRYARHLTISQVGEEGQKKLKNSRILLVGIGGLGSVEALYLAAAGVGMIGIIDFDQVESSNLQRQIIHSNAEIGQPKVESARRRMAALNPGIQIEIFHEPFTIQNAEKIIKNFDIVLDGSDNLPTRYLINDSCFFSGKPYIYGSVYEFEGHVSVFDARQGPCYRCLFPAPSLTDSQGNNMKKGVFGALPGTIGTIQATEAIKIILGIGTPLIGTLLLYDALDMSFQQLKISKNPACKICGSQAQIKTLEDGTVDYPDIKFNYQ